MTQSGTVTSTPTETELTSKISASPLSAAQLFDKSLADAIAKDLTNAETNLVPSSSPVTPSASPVVGPDETISTQVIPNADGTT